MARFDLLEPKLSPNALQVPGNDVYQVLGTPVDEEARQLVARMGGALPSATVTVSLGAKVSEADLAYAQQVIDQRVREALDGLAS